MATAALFQSIVAGQVSEVDALFRFKLESAQASQSTAVNGTNVPLGIEPTPTAAFCYTALNRTSRSFTRVIRALHPELRHCVCLFYLILRGLDTVEDDMTLDAALKTELLTKFYTYLEIPTWRFEGSGPNEADSHLLIGFNNVIEEYLKLPTCYREPIAEITQRMGEGMASFAGTGKQVVTLADYNEYTHYVAGLVGIGLSKLFVASKLEPETLIESESLRLANCMGLFLQKINILKDFLQDLKEGRLFWPQDVYTLYTPNNDPSPELLARPENRHRALMCLNHLCLDALQLVPDCLKYLAQLTEPTVLEFCAIPQLMAMASLDYFYNNPIMFQRQGNKIRRGLAVKLMRQAKSMHQIYQVYRDFALSLNRKNSEALESNPDHHQIYLSFSSCCAKILASVAAYEKQHGLTSPPKFFFSRIHPATMALCVLLVALGWAYLPHRF